MKKTNSNTKSKRFPHLLLLEASAGSGKTQALARRYVEYLLAGDVPCNRPANLLAITFTRNAAREMKERILLWLKSLALGSDAAMAAEMQALLGLNGTELASRASAAVDAVLDRYSDFQVQTIDSFANRLAQAAARELGLRPDFTVTTSPDELLDYALAQLLSRVGPGRDAAFTAAMEQFLAFLNETGADFVWDVRQRMRDAFETFLKIEAKESGRLAFGDQRAEVERLLAELKGLHDQVKAHAHEHGLPWRDDEKLLAYIAGRDIDGICGRKTYHGGHTLIKKTGLKKAQLESYEASKQIWAASGPVVAALAVAAARGALAPYGGPFGRFERELQAAKQRQGICFIDDIARTLAESLRREMVPSVYLALGERIHHFLVDEFQDTDPAQWRSLQPLLAETLAGSGSAFLVGDLKQAIYMFRKADYRIMRGLKGEIESRRPARWLPPSVAENASVSHLEHNYRSGGVIVDYVAEVFRTTLPKLAEAGVFGEDRSGLSTYEQSAAPGRQQAGFVCVRHIGTAAEDVATDDGEQAGEGTLEGHDTEQLLMSAVLETVNSALARGFAPGDIAILAATNDRLERAIDWLNQEQIPAASSSGLDIRRRAVVAELLALLRWLDSPIDELAWAPLVAGRLLERAARAAGMAWDRATAEALLSAAGQRRPRGGYLYQACREDPAFAPLWDRFFEGLYKLARYAPVYDLACTAVKAFAVLETFPEEASAVLQLLEAINRHETEHGGAIGGFLAEAWRPAAEGFGLEMPGRLPAVQLLTFHKAKGMGFPVVVNILGGNARRGGGTVYETDGEVITIYQLTRDMAARTAGFDPDLQALRDDRAADEAVQQLNSLYVACTRARDELYNLVIRQPGKGGAPSAYEQLFPEIERGARVTGATPMGAAVPPLVPTAAPQAAALRWHRDDVWTLSRLRDAAQGVLIHRVLQDIEYLPDNPAGQLRELLARHRHLAPAADTAALQRQLASYLENPALACWFVRKEGRRVRREADYIGADGSLVRLDRVVLDNDAITVLDFKTGGEKPAAAQAHSVQLSYYIDVLRQSHPNAFVAGLIAYLAGTVVEVKP